MNITRSVVSERDRALLGGDYNAYHAQATRRIHGLRQRLGATNRGRKYTPKAAVTAENVAQNAEWVQLLLASAERAWADAMAMKSAQSAETTQKPMPGSTKRQIISRLRRATTYAENLVAVTQDRTATGAEELDGLEARAYLSLLKGGLHFEKARWQACLEDYAVAQIVYTALARSAKTDIYKDLLAGIVDPSIRYAAYQLQMPRTKAVDEIAIEAFPASQAVLRQQIEALNPQAFSSGADAAPAKGGPKEIPSTISWRKRTVKLVDANISHALGLSKEREDHLASVYQSFRDGSVNVLELATAYEDVITACQDAADATKTAIDELVAEGVDPGDDRMQSLQITRTAVNYAVIEWQIGRNRILCGATDDGLRFEPEKPKQPSKTRKDGKTREAKEESSGRKLSRLRERAALYEAILQSLDAVKELPGIIADTAFVEELVAKRAYFRALKCLAVGRSHAIGEHIPNALALYARALDLAQTASSGLKSASADSPSQPPKLDVSSALLMQTATALRKLVTQYRALAELQSLTRGSTSQGAADDTTTGPSPGVKPAPFIEQLTRNEFVAAVDLTNLVNYPPQLRPVPVKPLFFDLAWNYITYPGQQGPGHAAGDVDADDDDNADADVTMAGAGGEVNGKKPDDKAAPVDGEKKPAKKGWFGFGR